MVSRFKRIALEKTSVSIKEGIEFLTQNLETDSCWLSELVQMKSRSALLQKKNYQGVITENQYSTEYSKLTEALIDLIVDISDNNPTFKNHFVYCRLFLPEEKLEIDFPVFIDDVILVGRSGEADVKLKSSSISRDHCKIFFSNRVFRVVDLESTNGTFLNGTRIKNSVVSPGDEIQLDNYRIMVFDLLKTDE